MSKNTMIGNDRLHSGNKTVQPQKHFNRSTHNLDKAWRSSMAAGTLVPFHTELALPGQTNDYELFVDVKTLPTVGPLFGSFDIQLDLFSVPVRLYNANMLMNQIDIGKNMSSVYLPQIEMRHYYKETDLESDNSQINPSCIYNYFGIRGLGRTDDGAEREIIRNFNGVKHLMYMDIYKNYYANKQEEIGYVIHNDYAEQNVDLYNVQWRIIAEPIGGGTEREITTLISIGSGMPREVKVTKDTWMKVRWRKDSIGRPNQDAPFITAQKNTAITYSLNELFTNFEYREEEEFFELYCYGVTEDAISTELEGWYRNETLLSDVDLSHIPRLVDFPLSNIDDVRKDILRFSDTTPFELKVGTIAPFGLPLKFYPDDVAMDADSKWSKQSAQEGLAIKTYNSDLFNNWINKEWIDGTGGVNEVSAVAVTDGSFNIDVLNVAQKIYYMLNRISMSGGSLDDWQEAVYSHERVKAANSPVYHGSLIKDIVFQEVVSTADTVNGNVAQPLGTLAGQGVMGSKHIGGKVVIKTNEPSFIMGIVSITPNIDYSQGNTWDNLLLSVDDFHKPDLDAIGFQDLITDQMHWAETTIDINDNLEFQSAGKQVSWQNYMTAVNETHGNFAEINSEMFMTNNRRYEIGANGIQDLTTYIDPTKFNNIFAQTSLDAQNFWVQIGMKNTKRSKMSAKQIPNL